MLEKVTMRSPEENRIEQHIEYLCEDQVKECRNPCRDDFSNVTKR
jgi:hypothetical protein